MARMGVLELAELVFPIAMRYEIPPELVLGIIHVESGGNPQAISKFGAVGLMQVMPRDSKYFEADPAMGKQFARRPTTVELLDPKFNVEYGCKFLRSLLSRYSDDPWRAVAAYYAGPGNVPKTGEIQHAGARRYVELVKASVERQVNKLREELQEMVELAQRMGIPNIYSTADADAGTAKG